jgi:hypothetical protein
VSEGQSGVMGWVLVNLLYGELANMLHGTQDGMYLTIAPKTMGRAVFADIVVVVIRARWEWMGV